jgi:hypothetical protein
MPRRWLPDILLRIQTAKRNHNKKNKEQRLHHKPQSETDV